MLITVVAVLCHLGNVGYCVEEIVSDQAKGMTECFVGAQPYIADWMAHSEKYARNWRLDRWKCVPGGNYVIRGRA